MIFSDLSAQIVERIHAHTVFRDFKMQVRTGCASGSTCYTDGGTLTDALPDTYGTSAQVGVKGGTAAAVRNDNVIAV